MGGLCKFFSFTDAVSIVRCVYQSSHSFYSKNLEDQMDNNLYTVRSACPVSTIIGCIFQHVTRPNVATNIAYSRLMCE